MTTQYEELIGNEPSLNVLLNFVSINKKTIDEYNEECIKENRNDEIINYSVLFKYSRFAKQYNGYYYVGGHIKLFPNEPITIDILEDATKKNEFGEISHMAEIASQITARKELIELKKIIDIYYERYLEEYYAPPQKDGNDFCNTIFDSILNIFENKNIKNDEIYKKGGEGYEKLAKNTLIGKTVVI
jgi:hypothetical protein